jgi:hypothetical protein
MTQVMQPEMFCIGEANDVQGIEAMNKCLVFVTYEKLTNVYVIAKDDYHYFKEFMCADLTNEYIEDGDEWFEYYDVECDDPDHFMAEHDIQIKRTNLEDV